MKKIILIFFLLCTAIINSAETKPKLHVYLHENKDIDASTEALFITKFSRPEPITLPHAYALGLIEAFSDSATQMDQDLKAFFQKVTQTRGLANPLISYDNIVKLKLAFADQDKSMILTFVKIIEDLPLAIGKSDLFTHEFIKEECRDSLFYFDVDEHRLTDSSTDRLLYDLMSKNELERLITEEFAQAESSLVIFLAPAISTSWLKDQLLAFDSNWELDIHLIDAPTAPLLSKSIVESDDGTVVVDGKIFMNKPSFNQTAKFGLSVGFILIVVSLFLCLPTYTLSLIFLGMPGLALLCHSYLSDPRFIETTRKDIFKKGFYYAYRHDYLGSTLTPFERRQLFIDEIFQRNNRLVRSLDEFPGYYALSCYNYRDQEMKKILYADEIQQLVQYQNEYNSNLVKIDEKKKELEKELSYLLAPYIQYRDECVEAANKQFNNCPVVIQYAIFMNEYQAALYSLEQRFQSGLLTRQERDDHINALKAELNAQLNLIEPELAKARAYLNDLLRAIENEYQQNKTNCKISINYDLRLAGLNNYEWDLMASYSDVMSHYIMNFMDPEDKNFPDILDLRNR